MKKGIIILALLLLLVIILAVGKYMKNKKDGYNYPVERCTDSMTRLAVNASYRAVRNDCLADCVSPDSDCYQMCENRNSNTLDNPVLHKIRMNACLGGCREELDKSCYETCDQKARVISQSVQTNDDNVRKEARKICETMYG